MTTVANKTLLSALNGAGPTEIADAMRQLKLGTMLTLVDETITLDTEDDDFPLTYPALIVQSVRVVSNGGGSLTEGPYKVTDADGTAVDASGVPFGIATLSADGTTLHFADTALSVRVVYLRRSDADFTAAFSPDA